MEAAMTTNKPTKVCGLSDIEATITLARAGDKEAAKKSSHLDRVTMR
jgi:hypothetical protein